MLPTLERGSVAIVTGGARGIGLAVVRAIVRDGVGVACLDLAGADYTAFEQACRSAGVPGQVFPLDVRDRAAVHEAVRAAMQLGPVRYGVNCAGIDSLGDSASVTAEDWERVVDVDLNGVFYSCQAEYEAMREHGGSIVNIASMSGLIINRGMDAHVSYSAAKAGVIHLSKGLGVEWIGDGVRVNSVSPGYTLTELTIHNAPERNQMFAEHTPIGRLATVEEIADPVVFLLSDAAAYITAIDLPVDGGFTAW